MSDAERSTGGAERTHPESLLIDLRDLAALLKCSARHVWRLADAGKMPRPYKIGALCRWDRAGIEQWVSDGCPSCRRR
jgi:predicted DNA-binding transcriptional regulator AlpA